MSSSSDVVVIGIYGISGSGKTHILHALEQLLDSARFAFYEGADVISRLVPGGLPRFKQLAPAEQRHWREAATREVERACTKTGKIALVTGHCMLWVEDKRQPVLVTTDEDLRVYTHIMYLDTAPEKVYTQCRGDVSRRRPWLSLNEISQWQCAEKDALRLKCGQNRILYVTVGSEQQSPTKLGKLVVDFAVHNEEYNLHCAEKRLDEIFERAAGPHLTLVLDADRTIAATDTGKLFWERCNQLLPSLPSDTLAKLFAGPLGYSYLAFRQAALLYEEIADAIDHQTICDDVSTSVRLYPEVDSFLQGASSRANVMIVIITCGLLPVWENVIAAARLNHTVHIIGGCRVQHGFVVTPKVKGGLVSRLRDIHRQIVYAVGDSPLDIDMLRNADEALVVVAEENLRSKSMETALSQAVDAGLHARQILLPETAHPRLSSTRLSITTFAHLATRLDTATGRSRNIRITHCTSSSAAKILMTTTRNAENAGPRLREAYRSVGRHLALNYLTSAIGLETYSISHVQGGTTDGFRLSKESLVTIVALMRGGDPIANGINDVFPSARFVHAKKPADVALEHVAGQSLVLLVDTVVNEGRTMADFVARVLSLTTVRIVMVAGVVQEQAIHAGGLLNDVFSHHDDVDLITLRTSKNKYKGIGTTDTSNRLFNTTHML